MKNDYLKALDLASREAIKKRDDFQITSPVPKAGAGELRQIFGKELPASGLSAEKVIRQLVEGASSGLIGQTGPKFFAWVMGASNPAGVAADWLTSMWGQNAANFFCSPAAAIAEETAGRWLLELLKLPGECSVGFVTGATMANFSGIAAGRHAVLEKVGWDVEDRGLFGAPEIEVVIGEEAHATAFAALQLTGLGRERVHKIPPRENMKIDTQKTLGAISKLDGPAMVVLQAGHLNSGDFDNFAEIIPAAKEKGAWVHVDGAFGLWARLSPGLEKRTRGLEMADSWAVDGHKWLQTPYDSGFAICRHRMIHAKAMTIAASYLPVDEDPDPSHFVPELSRRARGFAVWAVLRHLGREGIVELVENHCRLAQLFAQILEKEPGIEVLNKVVLNQLVVRFGGSDAQTRKVIEEVLREGTCFVRGALWGEKWIMRISVISEPSSEKDIRESAAAIIKAWRKVQKP